MVIGVHAHAVVPFGVLIAPLRQGLRRRPLVLLEQAIARTLAFLERFRIDLGDDRLDCDIQVGKGEEHLVA